MFSNKKTISLFLMFLIPCIYLWIFCFIRNKEYSIIAPIAYLIISSIPCSIALVHMSIKLKIETNELVESVFFVSMIQGLLAVFSYFSTSFHQLLLKMFRDYDVNSRFYNRWGEQRLYGLSNGLTYAMPILQSFVLILIIAYIIKGRYKYLYYIPFILLSAVLNARISIVVIVIGFVLILLCLKVDKKIFVSGLLLIILIGAGYMVIPNILNNRMNKEWIMSGIQEMVSFFEGERIGYFSYFANSRVLALPKGVDFFFGEFVDYFVYSDVGYIRDIWRGGLIYLIYVYGLFVIFLLKIKQKMKEENYIFADLFLIFSIVILAVANIKGSIFGLNEFVNFLLLLYVRYCLVNRTKEVIINE